MNYEVSIALDKKVDDWQFRALEQAVDRQKYDIQDLERNIGRLQTENTNYRDAFNSLVDLLVTTLGKNNTELEIDLYAINRYL